MGRHLLKDAKTMKKVSKLSMRLSEGRIFQEEETVSTALLVEHAGLLGSLSSKEASVAWAEGEG